MTEETENQETAEKQFEKMTVKELREVAKDIPAITGTSSMKKDELLARIYEAKGLVNEPPAKKAASNKKTGLGKKKGPLSKTEMKALISQLHKTKLEAKESSRKEINALRRRINRLRKRTRKMAVVTAA